MNILLDDNFRNSLSLDIVEDALFLAAEELVGENSDEIATKVYELLLEANKVSTK